MTEAIKTTNTPSVVQLISVDPDKLIDLGHRLKQTAMDNCYPGDSVLVPFTDSITLVYHPEKEFLKPLHTVGGSVVLGSQETVETVQ